MKSLTIVVPAFNSSLQLPNVIRSLQGIRRLMDEDDRIEIVLSINHSNDNTLLIATSSGVFDKILVSERYLSFDEHIIKIIKDVSSDYVLIIGVNYCLVPRRFVQFWREVAGSSTEYALIGLTGDDTSQLDLNTLIDRRRYVIHMGGHLGGIGSQIFKRDLINIGMLESYCISNRWAHDNESAWSHVKASIDVLQNHNAPYIISTLWCQYSNPASKNMPKNWHKEIHAPIYIRINYYSVCRSRCRQVNAMRSYFGIPSIKSLFLDPSLMILSKRVRSVQDLWRFIRYSALLNLFVTDIISITASLSIGCFAHKARQMLTSSKV